MRKRILILAGTSISSLVVLLGLMWLMPSSLPVTHAGPNKIPSDTATDMVPQRPTYQVIASDCTIISRNIDTDVTWTDSCYLVMTSVVAIHRGVGLTIAPPVTGTWVYFQAGAQLQVLGDLQALGAVSQPITFQASHLDHSFGRTAQRNGGGWQSALCDATGSG